MAIEIPLFMLGVLPADTDQSARQFRAVCVGAASAGIQGSAGAAIVTPTASNAHGPTIGLLQGNPIAGQPADVMVEGVSKAFSGGVFAIGDLLMYDSTSDGLIIATSGNQAMALALEAGTAGQICAVLLKQYGKQ